MSHSRDQSQKENRTSSISKSFHEDEITNNACFFSSLLEATIDWNQLDDALKADFDGFPTTLKTSQNKSNGTIIKLHLKNPTTKMHLDQFGEALANLPSDEGRFRCYYGLYGEAIGAFTKVPNLFKSLNSIAERLVAQNKLQTAGTSLLADLSSCTELNLVDKQDQAAKAKIYFTGLQGDKVKPLKPGLRGIYVRIHGRLLKQSFTDSKFTYNISKWKKFESGLRVEFSIDWLRDQISLSRTGIRFSNEKLETDFKGIVSRTISSFIQPQLKALQKKHDRVLGQKSKQRIELAKKRVEHPKDITISGLTSGFIFRPETDGELALVISQPEMMKRVLRNYRLIDYNDQAPFDCILYSDDRREFVRTELEPNLLALLGHNDIREVELIITWTRAQWRIGAKKKAKSGFLELVADDEKRQGWYKLLEYASVKSKTPRKDYPVIVIEEVLKTS